MRQTRDRIDHLKALIETKIKHTYLDKYIQKPIIDKDKLLILNAILNTVDLTEYKKEQYIITTMLIQIALDAHDLITDDEVPPDNSPARISKQLTVLAGDYYSGLYYLLLSEIEDFKLIKALASAIKEINELKMKLYYNEFSSFQEFLNIVKNVESLLFINVANYVNETDLNAITEQWLITSRLIRAKKGNDRGSSSLIDKWLNHRTLSKYSSTISNDIDEYINTNTNDTKKLLAELPARHCNLKAQITHCLDTLNYNNTSVREEG